jgi:hypothetical protein
VKVPGAASKAFAAPFQIQLIVREAVFRGDQELLFVLALGFSALAIIQASIEALGGWALFGHLLSFQIVGDSLVFTRFAPDSSAQERAHRLASL